MGLKSAEKKRKKWETQIYTTAPRVLRNRTIKGGRTLGVMKKKKNKTDRYALEGVPVNTEPETSRVRRGDDASLTSSILSGSVNEQELTIGSDERVPDTTGKSTNGTNVEGAEESSGMKGLDDQKGDSTKANMLNPLQFGSYDDWERAQGTRKATSMENMGNTLSGKVVEQNVT